MLAAFFGDPARIASTWYQWGVALGLAVTVVTAAWVFFDSQRRQLSAPLWKALSLLSALVVAPGAVLSLFPHLTQGLGGGYTTLPILLAYLGLFATLVALVTLALYSTGVGVHRIESASPLAGSDLVDAGEGDAGPTAVSATPTITRVIPASSPPEATVYSSPKAGTTLPPLSRRPDPAPPTATQVMGSQVIDLSPPLDDRTRILQPEPAQPLPLAWLVVMNGHRAGKEFRLEMLTDIGRDSRYNPASVEDPTMSRQHARVRLEKEGFVIYDLASANGVLVNGQKEQRRKLENGDRITIGQTVFGFMMVAEDQPITHLDITLGAGGLPGGSEDRHQDNDHE